MFIEPKTSWHNVTKYSRHSSARITQLFLNDILRIRGKTHTRIRPLRRLGSDHIPIKGGDISATFLLLIQEDNADPVTIKQEYHPTVEYSPVRMMFAV